MPARLTNTGRVLLGMVAEGHRTGYAIKAEIERSTRFYWSASIGGIYPELKRLERDGLLRRSDDYRGEAQRHDYRLTEEGEAVLRAWLTDCEEGPIEMRNESLLKLRFAVVLDPSERAGIVQRMRDRHALRVDELAARLARDEFDDPYHRLTAEYGLGWNRWARDWCETTLGSLP